MNIFFQNTRVAEASIAENQRRQLPPLPQPSYGPESIAKTLSLSERQSE